MMFGATGKAFAKESSRSAHYVSPKVVKSFELMREYVALFVHESSLSYKQYRFALRVN